MNVNPQQLFSPSGLNSIVIYFLLILPVIVTFATIARHIFGLKLMSQNVLISLVFIFAFVVPGHTLISMIFGITIVILIFFLSYYIKKIALQSSLHYFGRISFVISMVSIVILTIMILIGSNSTLSDLFKSMKLNPYALVMAVILSEYFSASQTQKGIKTSRSMFINTFALALILAIPLSTASVQDFFMVAPYISLIFIVAGFFAGKYSGMRVNEVFRFRNISSDK